MRRPLSLRRLAVLVSLSLFGIAVLLASVLPNMSGSVLQDNIQNSGHVVVFAIVAIVAFAFGRSWGIADFYNYTQAALVGVICGIGIEALQYPLPDRDASLGDIGRDAIGVTVGLLVVAGLVSFRTATLRSWLWRIPLLMVAFSIFTFGVFPVVECLVAFRSRDRSAPVLMSTDHFWWKQFLSANTSKWWLDETPADWPNDSDGQVCYVEFHPDYKYPNIHLREVFGDWSAAEAFVFEVYSTMPHTIDLAIRIGDQKHEQSGDDYFDRYNTVREIRPGFQSISIPISEIRAGPKLREMDMSKIRGLFFFLVKPTQKTRLLFDNVRLVERDSTLPRSNSPASSP